MPSLDQRRAFNLIDFVDTMLVPVKAVRLENFPNESAIQQASQLERFLWLDLGTRQGFFPLDEAQQAFTYYYYPLFHNTPSFLHDYPNVFAPHLQQRVERAMGRKRLEGSTDQSFLGLPLFQAAVTQSARLLTNESFLYMAGALLFGKEGDWSRDPISVELPIRDIEFLLEGEIVEAPTRESLLLAGMLLAFQRMQVILEFVGVERAEPGLLRSIVQLSSWSLNLQNKVVDERFKLLVAGFEAALKQSPAVVLGFEKTGLVEGRYREGSFLTYAYALLKDWHQLGLLAASQGRGARR